jgi:hypothetical protein
MMHDARTNGGINMGRWILKAAAGCLLAASVAPAVAQAPNAALQSKQQAAMKALAFLDGEWAGPAEAHERTGTFKMTQTERVGTLLDGTIRLVEGRAFDVKGKTLFNAFAVISYEVPRSRYVITSYASGYTTTTELKVKPDGFEWEVPAGPSATMQFSAVVKNGTWTEVGDYVGSDGAKKRTFQMTVKRRGTSEWPAGTVVPR